MIRPRGTLSKKKENRVFFRETVEVSGRTQRAIFVDRFIELSSVWNNVIDKRAYFSDSSFESVLRAQGLLVVVNGTIVMPTDAEEKEKWLMKDGKASSILIASLNEGQANHLLSCETSKQMYEKIESLHKVKSEVRLMNLYEEYFSRKMNYDESVAEYVPKCSMLAAEIEDQGEKLSDNIKMVRIVSSLTPKFKNFRTVWYNVNERKIDDFLPDCNWKRTN